MKILKCALAALCLTTGFSAGAANSDAPRIDAQNGWVRWLPGDLPAAGYLTLSNHGDKPLALLKESSPEYRSVMLHRTVTANNTEHMEMVNRLIIPAHQKIDISPGNYHLMLMHARHPVAPGDDVHLRLQFSDGSIVNTVLKVKPANQLN